MKAFCVVLALLAFGSSLALYSPEASALDPHIISTVNKNPKSTWKAGFNRRFVGKSLGDISGLMGVVKNPDLQLPMKEKTTKTLLDLPTSFDARQQWGSICPSTNEIRDQSACGSCWAFGAAESLTDRICIASNGAQKPHLSANDLLACCSSCGFGCGGGDPGAAMQYYATTGIVDGGNYDQGGCDPYPFPICDHHVNGTYGPCPSQEYNTPTCTMTCNNGASWSGSKHFGSNAYQVPSDQNSIMTEIMTNGPVEAAFTVYSDFLAYKSGVYQYTSGDELGGHAIKILGWGVWTDGVTPYWIVANSWNTDWGNKGYFYILRGQDECGIEDGVVAATPASSKHSHKH